MHEHSEQPPFQMYLPTSDTLTPLAC